MPHYAAVCRIMPHYAALCRIMPHYAALCCIMPHYAAQCRIMPHYAALCRIMRRKIYNLGNLSRKKVMLKMLLDAKVAADTAFFVELWSLSKKPVSYSHFTQSLWVEPRSNHATHKIYVQFSWKYRKFVSKNSNVENLLFQRIFIQNPLLIVAVSRSQIYSQLLTVYSQWLWVDPGSTHRPCE